MNPISKILVPIDFTPQSAEAVRVAVELASYTTAELALVHFCDPIDYRLPADSIAYTSEQLDRMCGPLRQRLDAARLDSERLGARRVSSRLLHGEPAVGIVGVAAEEDFDLIVMGTHGRTGVSRWVMGSVAEKVVRGAPCAVLTVKASPAPAATVAAAAG